MENRDQGNKGIVGKINKMTDGSSSAKWNDYLNRIFIQLCVEEIGKGNRPNSHFNVNGWNNIVRKFNEITGKNLVYKQIRNHWDAMKKEWLSFKKLMHSETVIGWNPLKNSLDASEEWWSRKIRENVDFKKFKNKDLSLVWFEYDKLFSDVAATGERARAPSQRSENEFDVENEILGVDSEAKEVEDHVEIGDSEDVGLGGIVRMLD
ncbi:L10-interacting MYB domain-containing protein-like [Salvia miltiorrhiza]|uniref:L10-interacting MYB domain-containing protein-like n=1 Tax=Salvia miltiorrhiza TaxID=226208 RepID=UPI0025AC7096|nr:L10-interacting MYB domain-containing protein-like [Salvia miltiorrhiza]